ncbi:MULTISPECIES: PKD-like family lipoprotein [Butyricimonas]|uniref:PKD-like family lipoprotein n=1 Tax=Butyricimonas TaxID=574697 RepID=UPI001D072EB8|nr:MULTISPECIES: PKD-like family lipoprotein [Butyricimonas]MCB6971576.1 hypothetical protein [Butyricimonas synergistica]MCG4518816.1 PKD-like family lipoprotein [Butyricimonas sp. DFI.6.44]
MKKIYIFIVLLTMVGLYSCLDDKGNYDYKESRKITISLPTQTVYLGDEVTFSPAIRYEEGADTLDYSFEWKLDKKTVSQERELKVIAEKIGGSKFQLIVTDDRSGETYTQITTMTVNSRFRSGFAVLYEKNGKSCIAHINHKEPVDADTEFTTYYELYKEMNGEDLGEKPVKMIEHFYFGGSPGEILVIQRGGQGTVEIDGNSMKKAMLTRDEFLDGKAPENLDVKTVSYPQYTNVLLNGDGKIYTRFFRDPNKTGFHSAAYNSDPVVLPGKPDYKIAAIIESAWQYAKHILLYDELNGRMIHLHCNYYNNTEDYNVLWSESDYPKGFVPLHDMGDMKLVYGSSFSNQYQGSCQHMLLLKNDAGDYVYQTFTVPSPIYPEDRGKVTISSSDGVFGFTGGQYITEKSKFWLLKSYAGRYLFFTGGANNDKLYYHDRSTGAVKVYADFEGRPIAALHPIKNNQQMGLGMEDGEFLLYDVTDATFISGQPKLIKSITGFGDRIVDVIYRYGASSWDM